MASAKQKAHQARVKAFYAKHGRFPRKGELGRAKAAKAANPASSTSDKPKRRRKAKPKPAHVRLWRWGKKQVKKHPVRSVAALAGVGAVAHAPTRKAVARKASGGLARVAALAK